MSELLLDDTMSEMLLEDTVSELLLKAVSELLLKVQRQKLLEDTASRLLHSATLKKVLLDTVSELYRVKTDTSSFISETLIPDDSASNLPTPLFFLTTQLQNCQLATPFLCSVRNDSCRYD